MSASTWANSLLLLLAAFLLAGCNAKDEATIQREFKAVVEDDLSVIVGETQAGDSRAVLEKPYYRVTDYKVTKGPYRFDRRAEVSFYYLKTIRMRQDRKYRFSTVSSQWERYYKEMEYNLAEPRKKGL